MNWKIFFTELKKARKRKGYTQHEMSEKLKISITMYQNYEYNTLPPHEKLIEINQLLGVDLSRFIYQVNLGPNSDGPLLKIAAAEALLKEIREDLSSDTKPADASGFVQIAKYESSVRKGRRK